MFESHKWSSVGLFVTTGGRWLKPYSIPTGCSIPTKDYRILVLIVVRLKAMFCGYLFLRIVFILFVLCSKMLSVVRNGETKILRRRNCDAPAITELKIWGGTEERKNAKEMGQWGRGRDWRNYFPPSQQLRQSCRPCKQVSHAEKKMWME